MDYTTEVQTKLARARMVMKQHNVGALWLRTVNNVAWITGGVDVAVNTADTVGVASVVITQTKASVVTNSIEGPRLAAEDQVEARGFELIMSPWEQATPVEFGSTLGTDVGLSDAKDLSRELSILRSKLLPVEQDRFRALARDCADAMRAAVHRVRPGMSESEIAGILSYETRARNATPIVALIAVDDRIFKVRHPIPTDKVMDNYAMLVLCGRRAGLVCSVTRLVHFGPLSDELRQKQVACAQVDAAVTAASKPGATLDSIFKVIQDAYAQAGFEGEWKLHHQGGTAAYAARELIAVPGEKTALEAGMICAWNPSITGTKVEDTILVTQSGVPEILTAMPGWPMLAVEVGGVTLERPLILAIT
jgi:Xaa-Pro aminopeptidase